MKIVFAIPAACTHHERRLTATTPNATIKRSDIRAPPWPYPPRSPPVRPTNSRQGSLVLHEGHLLRLGKVLLLAQETAHRSINRALLRRRKGSDKVKVAGKGAQGAEGTMVHGSDEMRNKRTCGADADTKQRRSVSRNRDSMKRDSDEGIINNTTNNNQTYQPRTPGPAQDAIASSALATQAGYCLWCKPAPAGRQQRCAGAVVANSPLRRDRHKVHYAAAPYGRQTSTKTGRIGRTPPPKPWKQPRTRLKGNPYASSSYCRNPSSPPKTMTRKRILRRQESDREVLRSPSLSPGKVYTTRGAAVVDGSGRARPEQPPNSSSDVGFEDENDGLLEQEGGGLGYTVPGDFFCSWECAGRWNAMFSPVQARHERGLRIDIAAGRVVTR